MATSRGQRAVWSVGLVAYLFGALLFALAPFLIPFVGAVVLLACASSTAKGPTNDWPIMIAAITEGAIGGLLASVIGGRPAWLEPIVIGSFYVGVVLPVVMIVYRLIRPRVSCAVDRVP